MTMGYRHSLTLALVAAVANGIAQTQTPGAAGNLTLNGSLVTSGVAIFDVARRVIVTSVANESARTFTITGTDRYGRAQTEAITGINIGVAQTTKDFLTVSQIAVDAATAGAVTSGTNQVASTAPIIADSLANPTNIGLACIVNSGTPTYTVEVSYDDLSPDWDLKINSPTWFPLSGFNAQTTNQDGAITRSISMYRLTNNSGIGSVTLKDTQALIAGGF